ncbi:hypothetical protein SS50377_24356 [Spironucleus salmonicida]|uniref:Uncharacterized protein n=1 Tax=Spironucleus salmonicida TaxID=348837 RepID=V6LPC5_9EUKA|nr:hypothetical protein SS50377_24356 [Spironucleus salmonicida]|eukprot:EST46093.1 Hypothetical protein SS50377_14084 [Spironucleus salmonicida]
MQHIQTNKIKPQSAFINKLPNNIKRHQTLSSNQITKSRPLTQGNKLRTRNIAGNLDACKSYFESESDGDTVEWLVKSERAISLTDFVKLDSDNSITTVVQDSLIKDLDIIDFNTDSCQQFQKYQPRKKRSIAATPESIIKDDEIYECKCTNLDNLAQSYQLYLEEIDIKTQIIKPSQLSNSILQNSQTYIDNIQKNFIKPMEYKIILNAEFGTNKQVLIDKMIQHINAYNQISATIQTCFNPTPFQQKIIRNWKIIDSSIGKIFIPSAKRSITLQSSIYDVMPEFKFITPNINLK